MVIMLWAVDCIRLGMFNVGCWVYYVTFILSDVLLANVPFGVTNPSV